jgi:hypothetical protein
VRDVGAVQAMLQAVRVPEFRPRSDVVIRTEESDTREEAR